MTDTDYQGHFGEMCCTYIPIDIGVKAIGILTGLALAKDIISCFFSDYAWALWSPMIACYGIMTLFWVCTFTNPRPTYTQRKVALFVYLLLIVLIARMYYLYVIINEQATEKICAQI